MTGAGDRRRVHCDVCYAAGTVDNVTLAEVVALTAAHLDQLLPLFDDMVR